MVTAACEKDGGTALLRFIAGAMVPFRFGTTPQCAKSLGGGGAVAIPEVAAAHKTIIGRPSHSSTNKKS